jgi:hypothetical protein
MIKFKYILKMFDESCFRIKSTVKPPCTATKLLTRWQYTAKPVGFLGSLVGLLARSIGDDVTHSGDVKHSDSTSCHPSGLSGSYGAIKTLRHASSAIVRLTQCFRLYYTLVHRSQSGSPCVIFYYHIKRVQAVPLLMAFYRRIARPYGGWIIAQRCWGLTRFVKPSLHADWLSTVYGQLLNLRSTVAFRSDAGERWTCWDSVSCTYVCAVYRAM